MRLSGFDRLPLVHVALQAIHSRIKTSHLRADWPTFVCAGTNGSEPVNDILRVQSIAKAVAQHYRILDTTFIVAFNGGLNAAARIEVRNATEIFIEYKRTGDANPAEVWAIMAHELAHILLHRAGITFKETLQDEVLTDTAAIYLGFGSFFLSAQREYTNRISKETVETVTKTIGYISAAEMGYVLAQRDFLTGEDSSVKISSGIGVVGYNNGKDRFAQEQSKRPYVKRSVLNRMMYRYGWSRTSEREGILFPCLICKQTIRIPDLHRIVDATCRHCGEKLRCFS